MAKTYYEQLKDPKWQKRRLEIMQRDEFECQACGDTETTLHVHHLRYEKGAAPWEYEERDLLTLCEACHEEIHDLKLRLERCVAALISKDGTHSLLRMLGYGTCLYSAHIGNDSSLPLGIPVKDAATVEAVADYFGVHWLDAQDAASSHPLHMVGYDRMRAADQRQPGNPKLWD